MEKACASFHCKHDALDVCRLDGMMCNGADGDQPGKYCRHITENLLTADSCALCALGTVCTCTGKRLERTDAAEPQSCSRI